MTEAIRLQEKTASISAVLGEGASAPSSASARLPYAVVIPQRRPKKRDRGFIRAYAPDLMRCGIDQATFLAFLDGFNAAIASSPWVGGLDLAGGAVGAIPASVTTVAPITGTAVQLVAGIYKEIRARHSQNAYLLKMNDELFRPRGLYCLVMAYNTNSRAPNASDPRSPGVADSNIAVPDATGSQGTRHKIRSNDGVAGAANFPASAELIFPDPDDSSADSDSDAEHRSDGEDKGGGESGESSFTSRLAKFAAGVNNKRDLKSQVKFQRKNPTSAINALLDPKAELTAKDREKQMKKEGKQERKREKHERKSEKRQQKHPERAPKDRKVKQGILYLMIVNMPSEDDMNNAQSLIEEATGFA